jgi:hypothetical protein
MRRTKDRDIPVEFIRESLNYDPLTGVLTWLMRPSEHFVTALGEWSFLKCFAGKRAGCATPQNRWIVGLTYEGRGRHILAHRIAWVLMTGAWPEHEIDHRDGDGLNNRWLNLRPATSLQNQQNRVLSTRGVSGLHGVTWHAAARKWRARITVNYHQHLIGYFDTPEEAHAAYLEAKARLHPFQPVPRLAA